MSTHVDWFVTLACSIDWLFDWFFTVNPSQPTRVHGEHIERVGDWNISKCCYGRPFTEEVLSKLLKVESLMFISLFSSGNYLSMNKGWIYARNGSSVWEELGQRCLCIIAGRDQSSIQTNYHHDGSLSSVDRWIIMDTV